MADIKKFLDQAGVSTLWGQVASNIAAEKARAEAAEKAALEAAQAAQADVDALEALVGVLPEGTDAKTVVEYVNKKTEGIATDAALAELQDTVDGHTTALATLNGGVEVAGSVANIANAAAVAEVTKIVAGADTSFDTLKEIADWILNDTTGAADMANDIAALEAKMVGVDETVVKSIADAIDVALKVDGADKYALASALTDAVGRIKALEDAGHVTQSAIDAGVKEAKDYADGLAGNYDAAGTAAAKAAAAESAAKAHADGLNTAMDARVVALEAIDHDHANKAELDLIASGDKAKWDAAAGKAHEHANKDVLDGITSAQILAWDAAEANAKAYADTEIAKIQALTPDEVLAAINGTANA